jgi:transcriptional regulator with XRE-family HTH domain
MQMPLTSGQLRAARGFVGWSARELAGAAKLGLSTVQRVESGGSITAANMDALQRALETAGVEFIPENGGGVGVRLRKQDQ